jgi:hypothetical protein
VTRCAIEHFRPGSGGQAILSGLYILAATISGAGQCCADWTRADVVGPEPFLGVAEHSGISKPTIGRLESIDSDDPIGGRAETGEALVAALEKAGIEFIPENGGGAG